MRRHRLLFLFTATFTLLAQAPSQTWPRFRQIRGVADLFGHVVVSQQNGALFVTDGSSILHAAPLQSVSSLTVSGRYAYFSAFEFATGQELWRTDGTAAGTGLFFDFDPGRASGAPVIGRTIDELLFVSTLTRSGSELYRTDGTTAGTWRIGLGSSREIETAGGRLVYLGEGPEGAELHSSDGSPDSGGLLVDLRPGSMGSNPREFVRLGDQVLFTADDGANGTSLWATDGTAAGTRLLLAGGGPTGLTVSGGLCFFRAVGAGGAELWKSDGTTAGTMRVADIVPGSTGSFPDKLAPLAGGVVFYAVTPADGQEPWFSDGTAAGTRMLAATVPGPTSTLAQGEFLALGERRVRFAINSGASIDTWETDGTPAGTRIVHPGAAPALVSGGRFFYTVPVPFTTTVELRNEIPGAISHPVGHGRGADFRRPELAAGDPILGAVTTLRGSGANPGLALVFLGLPTTTPMVAGPGYLLPLTSLGTLGAPAVQADGTWSFSLAIPASMAFQGFLAGAQAIHAPSNAPLGLDATNAVVLRLGM